MSAYCGPDRRNEGPLPSADASKEGFVHQEFDDFGIYRSIISSLPVAVVTISTEMKIAQFNPWAEKMTGYSANQAVGKSCKAVLQGGICNIRCPIKPILDDENYLVRVETTLRNRNGKVIPIRLISFPLRNLEGEFTAGVEIFEDLSDLKSLEREKSDLISMLAHDMRSSITGIHGLSLRLLRKAAGGHEEKEHKYLEIITREAARLGGMVEDFLEYSRLQAGRFQLNFGPTSLNKLLLETFDSYKLRAQQRGLQLRLSIDGIMPVIQADGYRLQRVFGNLLDNALKFSKPGGAVTITAGETGRELFVRIEDEGIGIAPEDMPHIFELFQRGNDAGKQMGYGMGLAVVRVIVDGHGGRVVVASELGKGSVFSVFLPRDTGMHERAEEKS